MVISAIATAEGRGGISVVRMSGEGSLGIAQKMFSKALHPNMMCPGEIDCGDFRDFGMCVYFRAPRSFTGEDVVEFHCHGGREIARGVLQRTIALGARLAERGEFTKRAFLNGKLSLSAAEGMADMINASSRAEVRAGYLLYGETLTRMGKELQGKIRTALASADADIDYPEEELNAGSRSEIEGTMSEVEASLCALCAQYNAGRKLKQGVFCAILGKPNAGKSTLLNALLGYDRAIVSPVAGTTRDTVEGEIELHGVRFRLVDTAGMRESADEIETEGVRRAEQAMRAADIILWLKEDDACPVTDVPVIVVGAKCDLSRKEGCDILVSARTGEGIEELKECLYARGYGEENEGAFLLEERHLAAARDALAATRDALAAIRGGLSADLYAEDLRRAYLALGLLTGESASEDVIAEIFDKFCVGK